jgi:hypothetical protein
MADDISGQDIRLTLARVRPSVGRLLSGAAPTISRDIARTELARRLVQLSGEGVRDETKLSLVGLRHLNELTVSNGKVER